MGKIVTIYLSDEEAKNLQGFCVENQCTQYSALKTAVKQLLSKPIQLEETTQEIIEEIPQEIEEEFSEESITSDDTVEETIEQPDETLTQDLDALPLRTLLRRLRNRNNAHE